MIIIRYNNVLVKEGFRGGIMKEQEFMSYWKSNHGHLHRQKPQTVNKSTKSKASPKIISSRHESFGSDGFEFGGEDDSSFLSKHSSSRNSSRMAGGGAASTSSTVSNEVNMAALEALKKEQAARELAAKKALGRVASAGSAAGGALNEVSIATVEALMNKVVDEQNKKLAAMQMLLQDEQKAAMQMILQELAKQKNAPTVSSYFISTFFAYYYL
jgi:hypothetical protein